MPFSLHDDRQALDIEASHLVNNEIDMRSMSRVMKAGHLSKKSRH